MSVANGWPLVSLVSRRHVLSTRTCPPRTHTDRKLRPWRRWFTLRPSLARDPKRKSSKLRNSLQQQPPEVKAIHSSRGSLLKKKDSLRGGTSLSSAYRPFVTGAPPPRPASFSAPPPFELHPEPARTGRVLSLFLHPAPFGGRGRQFWHGAREIIPPKRGPHPFSPLTPGSDRPSPIPCAGKLSGNLSAEGHKAGEKGGKTCAPWLFLVLRA